MHTTPVRDDIMKLPQVCDRLKVSRSTLLRMISRGEIEAPLKLTRSKKPRLGWKRNTIEAHLARLEAEAASKTLERAGDRPPAVAPAGHLELRYAAKDRAEVAVRRLQRFGFVCDVRPAGEQYACAIRLERGSVPHTMEMLAICCGDLLRVTSPVLVEAVEQVAP